VIVTDLRPELARISVPMTVLYVIPQNAPIAPDQYEAGLRQSFATVKEARLIRIDDSNHFIQIDQPARFVSEVDAFMKQ
jgi:pimeloyl-ACP methyl ester carboxylesterase